MVAPKRRLSSKEKKELQNMEKTLASLVKQRGEYQAKMDGGHEVSLRWYRDGARSASSMGMLATGTLVRNVNMCVGVG